MPYEPLEASEGPQYMQHIWGLAFKTAEDKDFYVQTGHGNIQRAAAEFKGHRIIFLVLDPELLELLARSEKLYAFGAYNQINVCQMRALGAVNEEEDGTEIKDLRKHLLDKLEGGHLFRDDDISQARELIKKGKPFCFLPAEYAYSGYERG